MSTRLLNRMLAALLNYSLAHLLTCLLQRSTSVSTSARRQVAYNKSYKRVVWVPFYLSQQVDKVMPVTKFASLKIGACKPAMDMVFLMHPAVFHDFVCALRHMLGVEVCKHAHPKCPSNGKGCNMHFIHHSLAMVHEKQENGTFLSAAVVQVLTH